MKDILINNKNWIDIYEDPDTPSPRNSVSFQNKTTDSIYAFTETTPPSDNEPLQGGVIVRQGETKNFSNTENVWVKLVNKEALREGYICVFDSNNIGSNANSFLDNPLPVDSEMKQAMNTVFGETIVAEHTDFINVSFQYNVSSWDVYKTETGTGSISHEPSSRAKISCGTSVGYAEIQSKDSVRYVSGKEIFCNFTAAFPTREVGVNQFVGVIDEGDGFAVGFNGEDFSILYRKGGVDTYFLIDTDFDPTGLHAYKVSYGWLGVLPANISVYMGSDKGWVTLYTVDFSGQPTPHLLNPSLPITAFTERLSGNGIDCSIYTSSWRGGIVGLTPSRSNADRTFQKFVTKQIPASTLTPLISILNKDTFTGVKNHVRARYGTVTISSEGNKPVVITIYKDGVLTGGTFLDYNTDESVCQYNITATAYVPTNPEEPLGGTVLGKIDTARINLFDRDVVIPIRPNENVTMCAESSNASDVTLFIRHIEEF